jgi:hypothetical protein
MRWLTKRQKGGPVLGADLIMTNTLLDPTTLEHFESDRIETTDTTSCIKEKELKN